MPALGRRHTAVERGVAVEHFVILDRALLQAGLLSLRIELRGAVKDLVKAKIDLAGEEGDHAAHVMQDYFQVRQFVEQSGKNQPRGAGRGLIGPAEAEPDFVLRLALAGVVGHLRSAHRMYPHRQVKLGHFPENRPVLRQAERLAQDVGEDLDAARTELADAAVNLLHAGINVIHRHRGDPCRKAVRVLVVNLCQAVVGNARKERRHVGAAEGLDGRVGQGQHLLQVVKLVHHAQARRQVKQ